MGSGGDDSDDGDDSHPDFRQSESYASGSASTALRPAAMLWYKK